jgi:hypothetical protein
MTVQSLKNSAEKWLKRFLYVSSTKQKNDCGDMADFGMVNFEKLSTGWRSSCGLIF